MRRVLLVAVLAGLALLAGCSKRHGAPNGPGQGSLPPAVTAVFPAPHSTVLYDTALFWAQFVAPLDSATVSPLNVYLKVDDRRIPIAVAWEAATRRILIRPMQQLALMITHTVELSPNLASAEGVPLGSRYFWQFTTSSLGHPVSPFPADGTRGESPFVRLTWAGNEATEGAGRYDVYAGPDSAAVATRAAPLAGTSSNQALLPRTRWMEDSTTYWSVTAVNLITGERLDGPVWRFGTLGPRSATVEQDTLAATDWGYQELANRYNRSCGGTTFSFGPGYVSGLRFRNVLGLPATTRLAGARMVTTMLSYPTEVSLWPIRAGTWLDCTGWLTAQPQADETIGQLAIVTNRAPSVFESDRLTAHLEATIRGVNVDGYLLRAPQVGYAAGGLHADAALRPRLILQIYRPGASAAH